MTVKSVDVVRDTTGFDGEECGCGERHNGFDGEGCGCGETLRVLKHEAVKMVKKVHEIFMNVQQKYRGLCYNFSCVRFKRATALCKGVFPCICVLYHNANQGVSSCVRKKL